MLRVADQHVVTFHVTTTTTQGEVVADTQRDGPLTYLHGRGALIPGLEKAMSGRTVGEAFTIDLTPDDAYGPFDTELELALPLDAFPEGMRAELSPGQCFHGEHPDPRCDGQVITYRIARVEPERVLASGNHPLAGEALHAAIEILAIRAATEHEMLTGEAESGAHPEIS